MPVKPSTLSTFDALAPQTTATEVRLKQEAILHIIDHISKEWEKLLHHALLYGNSAMPAAKTTTRIRCYGFQTNLGGAPTWAVSGSAGPNYAFWVLKPSDIKKVDVLCDVAGTSDTKIIEIEIADSALLGLPAMEIIPDAVPSR